MTLSYDRTTPFANWWAKTFPGTPCPPLPTKEADLGLTALLALKTDNPKLAQLLFGNERSAAMPADTVVRRQNGQLQENDIPHLRAAGLEWEAQELERRSELVQSQQLAAQAEQSHQRAQAEMAYHQQFSDLSLLERFAHAGDLPQEVVIQNRQRWGVSGTMSSIKRTDMEELPPAIERGMVLRAQGKKWSEAAEIVGCNPSSLSRWYREDERARAIVDNLLREQLVSAYAALANSGVAMADRLIAIALDPRTRPYAASGAIKAAFEILEKGLLDREMRQQVEAMRQQLAALEQAS